MSCPHRCEEPPAKPCCSLSGWLSSLGSTCKDLLVPHIHTTAQLLISRWEQLSTASASRSLCNPWPRRAPSARAGRSGRGTAGSQSRAQAGCELAAAAGSLPGQRRRPGPSTKLHVPCQPHGGPTTGERFANPFIPAPWPAAQPPASFAGKCFGST